MQANDRRLFNRIVGLKALTDGYSGPVFAIGVIETNGDGHEINRHIWRLPDSFLKDDYTRREHLPTLNGIPVTHNDYDEMVASFGDWVRNYYAPHKAEMEIVVDVGIPEARLLRELAERRLVDFPAEAYPIYNVATLLRGLDWEPTNIERYLHDAAPKYGIEVPILPEPLGKAFKIAAAYNCGLRDIAAFRTTRGQQSRVEETRSRATA